MRKSISVFDGIVLGVVLRTERSIFETGGKDGHERKEVSLWGTGKKQETK